MLRTRDMTRRHALGALAGLGMVARANRSKLAPDKQRGTLGGSGMKVGRICATRDGESHIGELDIALTQNGGRPLFYNSTRFAEPGRSKPAMDPDKGASRMSTER